MLFERLETRLLMASDLANQLDANACSAFESIALEPLAEIASIANIQAAEQGSVGRTKIGWDPEVVLYGPSVGAPRIQSVVFGDGTAQRSNVTSITVQFDSIVSIAPGGFTLERKNGAAWDSLTSELTIQISTSVFNGVTRASLSFTGTGVVGGSLADGNYRLTAVASNITKDGVQLDGDANGSAGGNYVRGESSAENFFRRFGDLDGNRMVDLVDIESFKLGNGTSLGDSSFNSNIDFNGDGVVNGVDIGRFRIRNGTALNF